MNSTNYSLIDYTINKNIYLVWGTTPSDSQTILLALNEKTTHSGAQCTISGARNET